MAKATLESGLEGLIRKLEEVGGSVTKAVEEAMSQAAEKVNSDTRSAVEKGNLPAHGKFSTGRTEGTIRGETAVKWEGAVASVKVGFDLSKPGAGVFLIHGTPRMIPDRELNRMFGSKNPKQNPYMKEVRDGMADKILSEIAEAMKK